MDGPVVGSSKVLIISLIGYIEGELLVICS